MDNQPSDKNIGTLGAWVCYADTITMAVQPWHTGTPPEQWGEQQTSLSAHFLQSRGWALFQQQLGKQLFYASDTHWSWIAILEANRFGSRLYVPYGPTATSPVSLKKAISALLACAQAQGVDLSASNLMHHRLKRRSNSSAPSALTAISSRGTPL